MCPCAEVWQGQSVLLSPFPDKVAEVQLPSARDVKSHSQWLTQHQGAETSSSPHAGFFGIQLLFTPAPEVRTGFTNSTPARDLACTPVSRAKRLGRISVVS